MAATSSPFHLATLPEFPLQNSIAIDPSKIICTWITSLETALSTSDLSALDHLFVPNCWWRDTLALSWDFRTVKDLEPLKAYLSVNLERSQLFNIRTRTSGKFKPSLQSISEKLQWIESMIDFETAIGRGSGMVRIVQDADGEWKGYMVYTSLQELKGFEETIGIRRPHGGSENLENASTTLNWQERRDRQRDFLDEDPTVLVIGAGQSGLSIGARLQQLGVPTLIVERNKQIGDNWRQRYRTLVLHDPVHFNHMAYLPFPANWPIFASKDKLGDWLEAYASIMELNVWASATILSAEYNDETSHWAVKISRGDGKTRTIHPKHVILATGLVGEPRNPSFRGLESFKGEMYHASQHKDASSFRDIKGKKVVVVGTGNSGHDIAQNFCESGADVTMLQRGSTYVITAKIGVHLLQGDLYGDNSPPVEEADIYAQSMPIPVQLALDVDRMEKIVEAEEEVLNGLIKAGFHLDYGIHKSGIFSKFLTIGGGYYIDVGCSQLIIDGKIKIKQSVGGIEEVVSDGLVLSDGANIKADIVVLATGYDNMKTTVSKILGNKVADRCKDVWNLDEEGELNTVWRWSGHPGFWFMGGNLSLCRIHSKTLALQIKAIEEGLHRGSSLRN